MSRFFKWMGGAILLSVCMMLAIPAQRANAQPGVSVSFQTFYDELSPYGQWIENPDYGYVWAPGNMSSDFRPYYTGGHWAMTDYGNTWVSDYDWGWAPFHYGRWAYDPYYGWVWIPGQEWGPAWVSWRSGGGCYGWAPMGPGVGISISIGSYAPPMDWWVFVPCQHIYTPRFQHYWRGARYNNNYYNQTTIINNTYINNHNTYVYGPRRSDVERTTGQRVNVYNIRNEGRPERTVVRGNDINMYRPRVDAARSSDFRPREVVRTSDSRNDVRRGGNRDFNSIQRNDQNMVREAPGNMQRDNGRNMRMEQQNIENARMRDAQQRDAQVQQREAQTRMEQQQNAERVSRQRDMQMQQQQQMRNAQVQQQREAQARIEQQQNAERMNRQRDMQMQQQQQMRDAQVQQQREAQARMEQQQNAERMNRQREAQMQQQQQWREAQAQAQARQQQQQNMEQMNRQRQMQQQQQMQQQRAMEERARQQQTIENNRTQRWENQQARPVERQNYNRDGANMQMQRPQQNMDRGNRSDFGRGRR